MIAIEINGYNMLKILLRANAIRMSNKCKKQTRILKETPVEKSFSSAKNVISKIAGREKIIMSWASLQDCATGTSRIQMQLREKRH